MTIAVGDTLPDATFMTMTAGGPGPITSDALFAGKTVVIFALPGAFTPTCSARHVPGFVMHSKTLKSKGVDTIACVSVNDVFVMNAWGKDQKVGKTVMMLADGNATFSEAVGLTMDGSAFGMGTRSQRYAMIVKDGVVSDLFIEDAGAFDVSSAEHVLKHL